MQPIMYLRNFIIEKLREIEVSKQLTQEETLKWAGFIEISEAHAKEDIGKKMLIQTSESQRQIFCRNIFYDLTQTLTLIHRASDTINQQPAFTRTFFNTCVTALESMISYLHNNFSIYLKYDTDLSPTDFEAARQYTATTIEYLKNNLLKGVTDNLAEVLLEPFNTFLTLKSCRFSQWSYINKLAHAVNTIKHNEQIDVPCEIRKIFGVFNCNTESFLRYMAHFMENEINQLSTAKEKIDLIALRLKQTRQLQSLINTSYDPEAPTPKEFVLVYLETEMVYQQLLTSSTPQLAPLKYTGPTNGLVEIGYALKDAGFIQDPLEAVFHKFALLFDRPITNYSRTFQEILIRKKDDTFLSQLDTILKRRKDNMVENYRPRK